AKFSKNRAETIHGEVFNTRNDMRYTVSEYIEVDYNRHRRHSASGHISPEAFEAQKLS
ncbi:IS3 family transposase, partial [Desulfosarcina sp. OttesenSCG-928-G10]|nr:IS3 family transposase [Desulfosarcina sp. OttesenSCG-928-G10]